MNTYIDEIKATKPHNEHYAILWIGGDPSLREVEKFYVAEGITNLKVRVLNLKNGQESEKFVYVDKKEKQYFKRGRGYGKSKHYLDEFDLNKLKNK